MSYRYRKSIKLFDGLKLNVNKGSLSLTTGIRGAHYTLNSRRGGNVSAGIPGTGLYFTHKISKKDNVQEKDQRFLSKNSTISSSENSNLISIIKMDNEIKYPENSSIKRPFFFSGEDEKRLYLVLEKIKSDNFNSEDVKNSLIELKNFEKIANVVELLLVLPIFSSYVDINIMKERYKEIYDNRDKYFNDALVIKYLNPLWVKVEITPFVHITSNYIREIFSFLYAELLQRGDELDKALEILELLPPNTISGLSIADIELQKMDYKGVLDTTNKITPEDELSTYPYLLRGIALRESGLVRPSIEVFAEVVRSKYASDTIKNLTRIERSRSYLKEDRKGYSIKDLNKVLISDPDNLLARELLTELT